MPSIVEDIAKALGVSNATVSRALNDKPGVGSTLRDQILAKAREMNYVPNFTARSLANSQTYTIGFFVREKKGLPSAKDPFYYEIQLGVEQAVAKTDYHVSVATLTTDVLARPQDFRFTRERRIDGMILAGPDIPAEFIMAMLRTHIPLVLVDNRLNQTAINAVNSDDESGAYHATRYLIGRGHLRIGMIAGPQNWSSSERRVNGYHRAIAEAGLSPHISHVDRTTVDSGMKAYLELNSRQPELTGLCAANDSMAIGAMRAAQKQGRSIPDDLSVIGFDDIELAALSIPSLTTMHVPKTQIGKEAARRLLAILDDPDLLPAETIVPVNLIERESVMAIPEQNEGG